MKEALTVLLRSEGLPPRPLVHLPLLIPGHLFQSASKMLSRSPSLEWPPFPALNAVSCRLAMRGNMLTSKASKASPAVQGIAPP